ncbi:MAG: DUF2846 domain-containing protein [Desulfovibrio sp.]|jgi:hypothetical protein|nr:DUF2846 domain-containing protein [Desulfovibrio sp.]
MMTRKLTTFLAAVLVLAVAGCAKMPLRADYVYETNPQIPVADDSSAVIYFFRESAFVNGGLNYFINEDANRIGLLKSGTYFVHKTTPSKHTYWVDVGDKVYTTLDIKAGQTYYIDGGIDNHYTLFTNTSKPHFMEVTRPIAEKILPGLRYARLSTEEEAAQIRAKEAWQ